MKAGKANENVYNSYAQMSPMGTELPDLSLPKFISVEEQNLAVERISKPVNRS